MTVEISLPWNIMSREQLNTKVECSKKSPSVAGFAAPQLCLFLLPLPPSLPFRLQRVYNKTFIEPACIDCIGKYRSRSCSRFFFVIVNWPRLRFYPWTCKKELNRYFPNTDFKNRRLFWWNKSWKSRLLFQLRLRASSSIIDIYNFNAVSPDWLSAPYIITFISPLLVQTPAIKEKGVFNCESFQRF